MKISERGQELIGMRKELDRAKGNVMLTEALQDYLKKNTSAQENKLILESISAAELQSKISVMKEYVESEEDLYQSRIELISKLIVDHANPKNSKRSDQKKVYKLKYTLKGNHKERTYTLTRKFGLGERFLREYFGVTTPKEIKRLMENGFLQEYVGLRIPYVLNDLINGVHKNNREGLVFDIGSSYFSPNLNLFNIDMNITFSAEEGDGDVARKLAIILMVVEDRFSLSEF